MKAIFLLIIIFDGIVVGNLAAIICKKVFGDKPMGRLLRLIFSVGGGIGYAVMCLYLESGEIFADISIGGFLLIVLAPVALVIILWVLDYMFSK